MNKEIPDFLIEMSKQINSQNNRMTADPMFEVRYKQYLVTEDGYNESHWEIVSEDGCSLYHSEKSENYSELSDHLFESYKEWCQEWLNENELDFDVDDLSEDEFSEYFCDLYDHDDVIYLPDGIKKFHMQEIEVTVNSHFTEADAQAFINRKQHDYPNLYIYAISLCYCWNMIELRNWIKELTNE